MTKNININEINYKNILKSYLVDSLLLQLVDHTDIASYLPPNQSNDIYIKQSKKEFNKQFTKRLGRVEYNIDRDYGLRDFELSQSTDNKYDLDYFIDVLTERQTTLLSDLQGLELELAHKEKLINYQIKRLNSFEDINTTLSIDDDDILNKLLSIKKSIKYT